MADRAPSLPLRRHHRLRHAIRPTALDGDDPGRSFRGRGDSGGDDYLRAYTLSALLDQAGPRGSLRIVEKADQQVLGVRRTFR